MADSVCTVQILRHICQGKWEWYTYHVSEVVEDVYIYIMTPYKRGDSRPMNSAVERKMTGESYTRIQADRNKEVQEWKLEQTTENTTCTS